MSKQCSNKNCLKNNLPLDAVFCPDCGTKILNIDNNQNLQNEINNANHNTNTIQPLHQIQFIDHDSYSNFLKRNWWFILLGSTKVIHSASEYELNELSDTFVGDLLIFYAGLFGIMTVYWFIRYKVLDI